MTELNESNQPESERRSSGSALNCFVMWLGPLLMTKNQRFWLGRLGLYSDWKYDKSDPSHTAIVSSDGHTAYLECDAVRIRNKENKIVCTFDVDWVCARKMVCIGLATYLAT